MRARFVISAAILAGAALAARPARRAADPPGVPLPAAPPPATPPAPPSWPARATGAPLDPPPPAAEARAPEGVVIERGHFALGGHAVVPGHATVAAVSFATPRPGPIAPEAIRLELASAENVPAGGLVVLSDPGFAPDPEGFTLMLAAAGPGGFAASGWYELVGHDEGTGAPRVPETGGIAR